MRGLQANVVVLRSAGVSAAALLCAAAPAWAAGDGGFYAGDLGQAIAAIAVFVVLLLILRKWAWAPIIAQLRQREDTISGSLQRAKALEAKAQQLLDDYSQRLDKAQGDAAEVIARAKTDGEQLRQEILAAAMKEAKISAMRAKNDIAAARDEVLKEMRQTTAEMAMDIAEQIIRKGLSPSHQRRLLNDLIEEIRSRESGVS